MELQTNGQTDNPITRCPRRTFQAGGIKVLRQQFQLHVVFKSTSPAVALVLVCCGLMSHSAIFQLHSNGTVLQFPNRPVAEHPMPWAARGLQRADPGTGTSLTSLPSEGPHARVYQESNPDFPSSPSSSMPPKQVWW